MSSNSKKDSNHEVSSGALGNDPEILSSDLEIQSVYSNASVGLGDPVPASQTNRLQESNSNEKSVSKRLQKLNTSKSFQSKSSNVSKMFSHRKGSVKHDDNQTEKQLRSAVNLKNESSSKSETDRDLSKLLSRNFEFEDALRLTASHRTKTSAKSKMENLQKNLQNSNELPPDLEATKSKETLFPHGNDKPLQSKSLQKNFQDTGNENEETDQENISNGEEDVQTLEKVFTNHQTNTIDLPPDGGKDAYGSLVAVLLIMFCSWGANASNGIILAFFLNTNKFAGGTKFKYAVISGLSLCIGQFGCPFVSIVVKVFGIKPPICFGILCTFLGYFMGAFATKLWHLFCTLGLLCGVGISFTFLPATAVLPGWFLKKRSMALGTSLVGTGLGGFVFSLSTNALLERDQNQKWALIAQSIVCAGLSTIAVILVKQRNPPPTIPLKEWRVVAAQWSTIFSIKIMKRYITNLIAFWFTLAIFGYNLMILSLSAYARARGLTANQASYLTVYMNVAQSVGRPMIGLSGDRFGRSNITVFLTTIIVTLIFAFWIPAHTNGQLVAFSVLIGLCIGVANVMNTVMIADSVAPKDFLASWSYINIFGSPLFLFAEAIVQALTVPENKSNPYLHAQIFAGFCFFVAIFLSLLIREYKVRNLLKNKLCSTLRDLDNYNQEKKFDAKSSIESQNDKDTPPIDFDDTFQTENTPDEALLVERKENYELLLQRNIRAVIHRAFYPIKI
ncbi:hypothetical protein ACO0RG_001095 [Hanseniaspora osmophila]|uniref:Putative transporter ESBP6 n=1 Tax=Hanseniaspora osmophila TaxID=56408 RepID=A0A1E5RP71_9ASCO|nr:putative transporter ESBP6 [Hanseniaspora osmophila]